MDCFKYRGKVGLDVALETLREGWPVHKFTIDKLQYYAKICRMQKGVIVDSGVQPIDWELLMADP